MHTHDAPVRFRRFLLPIALLFLASAAMRWQWRDERSVISNIEASYHVLLTVEAMDETPIAEHVTNLQFRYVMNLSDSNGFVQQPVRVISTPIQQSAIREVETTIECETVRAVNKVTNANANTSANGKQTISITTATSVRNLQFGSNARR